MTVLPNFRLGKVCFCGWCGFSGTGLELDVMASLVLGEETSGLAWTDGVLGEGNSDGEPLDSVAAASTAGCGGDSSGAETAAAVIGPDPTVPEDTDAAT